MLICSFGQILYFLILTSIFFSEQFLQEMLYVPSDQKQNPNISSSRVSPQQYSHPGISIKSIEIIKPQLDSNPNRKLTISLIFHELNDELRKLVRYVSSKYAMNLYNDWDSYWTKQKEWVKTEKQKGRNSQPGEGQLIVCDEEGLIKVMRQMKINPTLRVLLICQSMIEFQLKEEHSFVLITDNCKQLQEYLTNNKKRLIQTSKS